MLELKLKNNEIFGNYKDIKREMEIKSLKEITIVSTKYCFINVENERKLSYKEIKNLSLLDELEKIKYQNKVKEILKNESK